jgi:hypothetical protein
MLSLDTQLCSIATDPSKHTATCVGPEIWLTQPTGFCSYLRFGEVRAGKEGGAEGREAMVKAVPPHTQLGPSQRSHKARPLGSQSSLLMRQEKSEIGYAGSLHMTRTGSYKQGLGPSK